MNFQLTPENQRCLNDQIAAGTFGSPSQALNAGLDLLRRRDDVLAKIDLGRQQLDAGDFTEYDRAGLRGRLDELKQRALRASQSDANE
jgi:Arc/MetJ-type ribon-helix-helix transcriptional regulator